jgi:hypothetical protein
VSDTPVALFVYNRPEKTRRLVCRIEQLPSSRLRVIADGPNPAEAEDERKCREVREAIDELSDDYEIERDYASSNLGLKERFVTGLSWLFGDLGHESAIILEDDCIPDPSFVTFCDRMLEAYEDDEQVWDIAGTNHLGTWKDGDQDYHFSCYGGIWGWATWRSSWQVYDVEMEGWDDPRVRERIRSFIGDEDQFAYLENVYDEASSGENETWDYPWGFSRHANEALSVVPSRNLVENIGFDAEATNTKAESHPLEPPSVHSLDESVRVRDRVVRDEEYDRRLHDLRSPSRGGIRSFVAGIWRGFTS